MLSSADTVLNSMTAFATQSMRGWGWITDNSVLPAVVANVVLTAAALVLALLCPNVIKLITEGFKVLTILLPSIVAVLMLKQPSKMAALGSVGGGLVAYGVCQIVCVGASNWAYVIGFSTSVVALVMIYFLEHCRSRIKAGREGT